MQPQIIPQSLPLPNQIPVDTFEQPILFQPNLSIMSNLWTDQANHNPNLLRTTMPEQSVKSVGVIGQKISQAGAQSASVPSNIRPSPIQRPNNSHFDIPSFSLSDHKTVNIGNDDGIVGSKGLGGEILKEDERIFGNSHRENFWNPVVTSLGYNGFVPMTALPIPMASGRVENEMVDQNGWNGSRYY